MHLVGRLLRNARETVELVRIIRLDERESPARMRQGFFVVKLHGTYDSSTVIVPFGTSVTLGTDAGISAHSPIFNGTE